MLHLYDSGGTPGSTKYGNPRLLKLSVCGWKVLEEEHLTDPWQIFMTLSTPAGIQSTTIALARSMRAIRVGLTVLVKSSRIIPMKAAPFVVQIV